jgi:AcrR family transcriptional regulator
VSGTRIRILEATLTCVEQWGLAKTSLEDVASAAGLSRATVYRYFPGGRDQVISETVTWEVGNFLHRLNEAALAEHGIEDRIAQALIVGHRAIDDHKLLQQILSTEPEALLAELEKSGPIMLAVIRSSLAEGLAAEPVRAGVDIDEAAEYLARLFLSYLGSQGRWDLTDPETVHRLVRSQFLAGVIEADATG